MRLSLHTDDYRGIYSTVQTSSSRAQGPVSILTSPGSSIISAVTSWNPVVRGLPASLVAVDIAATPTP